jgi:NAD(P)H-nitrite reductase large subunit
MDQHKVIDGLKPVCICKGIRKKTFLDHVEKGVKTVRDLKHATGAGTGSCQGRRCTPRIEDLLKENGK